MPVRSPLDQNPINPENMPDLRKTSVTIYVPTLTWVIHEAIKGIFLLVVMAISSLTFPIVRDGREWWQEILMLFLWVMSVEIYSRVKRKIGKKADLSS